ncbi:hypothetical protein F5X96DRAFT_683403 [Biscogniauxia mediterranea]|nr:hypothetical protein F5X96DRAFT_683403 [Biscogniauxia mediterranea]
MPAQLPEGYLGVTIASRDNKSIEYYKALEDPNDPELTLANLSIEVDRVAGALTQSVYGYTKLKLYKRIRRWTCGVSKNAAILLPDLLIGFLHPDSVRQSSVSFIVMADICMMACLTIGAILLLAVLAKYVHIRRNALSWHVRYGESGARTEESGMRPWQRTMGKKRPQSIYDLWLLLVSRSAWCSSAEADLSPERARGDFLTFMPSVTASLLTFVVFETSRPFRETMYETFIPKRFRQRAVIPETPACSVRQRRAVPQQHENRTD